MQRFFATLVLFATAGALATEANRPRECPRAELFAAATKLGSPTALPERFARGEHGAIRAISLYESALASDHYRYSALVDAQEVDAIAGLLDQPDTDPTDLAAIDKAWEDQPVTFGPGATECKDGLIARIRAAKRPASARA